MLYWRYYKDMHTSYFDMHMTSYFGYFGHAWLHTPKMIVSTCTRLWCLSACKKYTSSFTSFLRYYILKNPAIWLADSIQNQNFARYEIGGEISTTILVSILDYLKEKLMAKFFEKCKNNLAILGPFYPNLGKNEFFLEKIFQLSIIMPKISKNYWVISEENIKLTDSCKRLLAWKYIILSHLVLLLEYSTEVAEVFQNIITF